MGWGSTTHAASWIRKIEAHAVFDVLSSFVDAVSGVVTIALTQIAEYSRLEKSQVQRGIRDLRRMRVISDAPPGRGGTRSYEIHPIFVIRKGAECPSPTELRRLFDELQAGISEPVKGATPESRGGYSRVSRGLLQGSQKVYSPVALSQHLYSHLYSHNAISQKNQADVESVEVVEVSERSAPVASESEGMAVAGIVAVAETIGKANGSAVRKSAAKKKNAAKGTVPTPEAWSIVDFYQTVHHDFFPLEEHGTKWRHKTRTVALRLLTRADSDEVKRRIKRMCQSIPPGKESRFGALVQLENQWERWGPGKEEAARLTGYQTALTPAEQARQSASRAIASSEALNLKSSFLSPIAEESREEVPV